MQIAIAGNIGAGKTELTRLLSKHYGYQAVYGTTDENPYLSSFYEDMRRWSFNMVMYSLFANMKQQADLLEGGVDYVRDRSVYDDVFVFAPNLQSMGLMTSRDLTTYTSAFELYARLLPPPDLMIYLRGDVTTLISHIRQRGREYEKGIRLDYLTNLNNRYDDWAENYDGRMIVVDMDECDFMAEREDLGLIINKIDAEFNGLFKHGKQQ
ncbi:MAG: deoxynucleoside kinase [Bacteroidales bacterium]|nr:deoxynucleoside kinase [Bacteroidales bacterium]